MKTRCISIAVIFGLLAVINLRSVENKLDHDTSIPVDGSQEIDDPKAFDPSGIYFHAWTGSSAGTEWALIHKTDGNNYRLTDWVGNGFTFELQPDASFKVLDDGNKGKGQGVFSKDGNASFDWQNWGMSFQSRIWRAHIITSEHIQLPPVKVNEGKQLTGKWEGMRYQVSPTTGKVLGKGKKCAALVSIDNGKMRFDWNDGSFDQGIVSGRQCATFIVFANAPSTSNYATPRECETSRDVDLFGSATWNDENNIEFNVLTQTRSKVGDQKQFQIRYSLNKRN